MLKRSGEKLKLLIRSFFYCSYTLVVTCEKGQNSIPQKFETEIQYHLMGFIPDRNKPIKWY